MIKTLFLLLSISLVTSAYEIHQTPINFGKKRIALTKEYIKNHYTLDVQDIKIVTKIVRQ